MVPTGKITEIKYDTICGIRSYILINICMTVMEDLPDVRKSGVIQSFLCGGDCLILNVKGQNLSEIADQTAQELCIMAISGGGIDTESLF